MVNNPLDAPPPPPPPSAPPPGWSQPGMAGWAQPQKSRRWTWVGLGLLCAVLVVAALFVVGRRTTPPAGPVTASFTDPTGHFSASYAGAPVQDVQSLPIRGRQIPDVEWSHVISANVSEIVGYITYPTEFTFPAPNAALDGAIAGEVASSHGTLVSKTFGTTEGFHSADAVISVQGGYLEGRVILAGHTLFVVIATSLHNPPEVFATFASSVRILSHAP